MIRKYIIVVDDSIKGCDEAIEKLEREWGAEEIEPCEDCISRESVIRLVEQYPNIIGNRCSGLIADIKHLPPVTPKTGHWIRQTDDYHDYYECEQCGIAVGLDDIKNYCPNCGAEMEIKNEKETC